MARYNKSVAFSDNMPKISQDSNSKSPKDTRIKTKNIQYLKMRQIAHLTRFKEVYEIPAVQGIVLKNTKIN